MVEYQGQIYNDPRQLIERDSRKTLYETLPFIAAFGMSSTEGCLLTHSYSLTLTYLSLTTIGSVKKIISRVSNMSLVSLDTSNHNNIRDNSNSSNNSGGLRHSLSNSSLLR